MNIPYPKMYSNEISKILGRNPATRRYFIGCYAADKLPENYNVYPYCFVANMDCSGWTGSHWIAIFVKSGTSVEYYDSLGHWPPLSPYIIAFLRKFRSIESNSEQLQSENSKSCGKHVIYFLHKRCSETISSISDLIAYFRKHRQSPDEIVNEFVRHLMHIQ